jgi:hypothetical protein
METKIFTKIFKARAKTLDIKTHKGWKYDDKTCEEETGNEILSCFYFGEEIPTKPLHYDMFYGDSCSVSDMVLVATLMMKKTKEETKYNGQAGPSSVQVEVNYAGYLA